MHHLVRALAVVLALSLPVAAPVAASTAAVGAANPAPVAVAAPTLSTAKVVIVVGPVEGSTTSYRNTADSIYAEAIKWSSNVTRIYSPNATWAVVKPALQGASVVVYLGHGNGWPSPYTYDPNYTTKDGMGLNASANAGDSNVKYYGEPSFANEIDFAPNAVVILNHLCYASGNSESGDPAPTLSVAMQRVDNFGQGFIKSGAGAVIAYGHSSVTGIIRDLFSTHQTVVDLWRNQGDANGNEFSFPSMRSPAFTDYMDPDAPNAGFYRSLVATPSLRTEDVTGVPYVTTDSDPGTLLVPGASEVADGGARMSSSSSLQGTTSTISAGTILRIDQIAGNGAVKLHTLAGANVGWTSSDSLIPRDSAAPEPWSLNVGPARIVTGSTTFSLSSTLSEDATWTVRITRQGSTIKSATGTGSAATLSWDGKQGGSPALSGQYAWSLDAADALGNVMETRSGTFLVWDGLGTHYVPVSPLRVLDTRFGTGLGGTFATGVPRTFMVAGQGSVPVDAIAVTGNVTVVNQTSAGYVSLTPEPTSSPDTSTLNFPAGDIRANGVTSMLGLDGSLSAVFRGSTGSRTNLIFDVTGYFVSSSNGASYTPIAPTRLLDSRDGTGLAGQFDTGTPRSVLIGGRGGVPTNAVAITGNLTITNQTSGGYVSITPTQVATPGTSNLNFPSGDNRANNFTAPLGGDRTVSLVFQGSAGSSADLIVDVTGYFVQGDAGALYIPIAPSRVLDTRYGTGLSGPFAAGSPRDMAVAGTMGIPSGAVGVTGNATVVGSTRAGYVTLGPSVESAPATSTINFPTGDTRANGFDLQLGSGRLAAVYTAAPGALTHLIIDITGYFLPS